jgi:hypothetical protein
LTALRTDRSFAAAHGRALIIDRLVIGTKAAFVREETNASL